MKIIGLTAIGLCITATPAWADRAITVHRVDKQEGVGKTLGTVTVREIDGRSLIIHAGMDDYDERTGGDPIACGVIGDLSKP